MNARSAKIIESAHLSVRPDWLAGERSHEIERLRRVVRDPRATREELYVAMCQLAHYGEQDQEDVR